MKKKVSKKKPRIIRKNRKQAQETRERQAKRDEIYRKEAEEKKRQQLYDLEVQDKANILSEIKNRNGERIYDVNNMSGYEIMSLYSDIEKIVHKSLNKRENHIAKKNKTIM